MVSEKVGGAEGTKLDEDFKDLEKVSTHTHANTHMCARVVLCVSGETPIKRNITISVATIMHYKKLNVFTDFCSSSDNFFHIVPLPHL